MEGVLKPSCPALILGQEVSNNGDNDKENIFAVDNVAPPSILLLQKNLRRSRFEYNQNTANGCSHTLSSDNHNCNTKVVN